MSQDKEKRSPVQTEDPDVEGHKRWGATEEPAQDDEKKDEPDVEGHMHATRRHDGG